MKAFPLDNKRQAHILAVALIAYIKRYGNEGDKVQLDRALQLAAELVGA